MKSHHAPSTAVLRLFVAVLIAFALVASACGDDDDSATTGDPSSTSRVDTPSDGDEDSGGDAEEPFAPDDTDATAADDTSTDGAESVDTGETAADTMGDDAADSVAPSTEAEASEGAGLIAPEPTPPPDFDRERDEFFRDYGIRDFVETDDDPLSTFALDVDTGAYTLARRYLNDGRLPPRDSVRVEEYVNFFDYDYDDPSREVLGVSVDGGPSPFDEDNYLVRVGVQSQRIDEDDRPAVSLTFVIDTSGSMRTDGKLDLVKEALEELVEELDGDDTVGIVEFDDDPSVVLDPTAVDDRDRIFDAIDDLRPGGSTNVEAGLRLGYDLANEAYRNGGVNRVVLLSDGVANVGLTDPDGLARMIRGDADEGIQLLTIGVGLSDFNDTLMEQLADQGDGFYAYVDTKDEAERLFEDRLTSTLVTLAIDAKIQVEFDADIVDEYRLIGFENRGVLDSDFRNDEVDAGEIGAGHRVTAIYEIDLRPEVGLDDRDDLGEVNLRWEEPGSGDIIEIDEDIELRAIEADWEDTSDSFKLAVVVATFAEILRESPFAEGIDLDDLAEAAEILADRTRDRDVDELAELIAIADRLS